MVIGVWDSLGDKVMGFRVWNYYELYIRKYYLKNNN